MNPEKASLPGLMPGRPRFGSAVAREDRMKCETSEEDEGARDLRPCAQ
jgi:hypothetical protein